MKGVINRNNNKGGDWRSKFGIEDRRTGGDRLSRVLRQSTIGAKGFNDRVRNGIGWDTFARATSSSILYYSQRDKLP